MAPALAALKLELNNRKNQRCKEESETGIRRGPSVLSARMTPHRMMFVHIAMIANRHDPQDVHDGDQIQFELAADSQGRPQCAKGSKILDRPGGECDGLNRYLREDV